MKPMASLLILTSGLIVLEHGDLTCSQKPRVAVLQSPSLEIYLELLLFFPISFQHLPGAWSWYVLHKPPHLQHVGSLCSWVPPGLCLVARESTH